MKSLLLPLAFCALLGGCATYPSTAVPVYYDVATAQYYAYPAVVDPYGYPYLYAYPYPYSDYYRPAFYGSLWFADDWIGCCFGGGHHHHHGHGSHRGHDGHGHGGGSGGHGHR